MHRDTVAVAYAGFFGPGTLPPLPEFVAIWRGRLADPATAALIASADGVPVGFAATGSGTDRHGRRELLGLFVVPERWADGVGSALHDGALEAMRVDGEVHAALWVIAANARTRHFYERRGWRLAAGVASESHPGVPQVRSVHRGAGADDASPREE